MTHIFYLVVNQKQVPKDVAHIFNTPSDSEHFPGFQDDTSKQSFLPENKSASFDSLESGKEVGTDCHVCYAFGMQPVSKLCELYLSP